MSNNDAQKNTHANGATLRAPVIVIMGHIDHGKSTLLDYIRKTNITAKEAGGITQHISAYEVNHEKDGEQFAITFLDTPGHEAFSKIRSRGATVADIAVLVVSAEDGVKPQTLEALKAIQSAKLPFIIAINKIDKPNANIDRTKQNLAENDMLVEGYGGDIPWVPISAKTGEGIPELLDMMLLVAEISELRGNHAAPASGSVIETNMDSKKGVSATLIIKNGTLKRGQFVIAGDAYAPVRIMENFLGKPIAEASFSSPVRIIGWSKLPTVGSVFSICTSKKEAEELVLNFTNNQKNKTTQQAANAGDKIIVPIIVKTDTVGSLEGIEHEIKKIKNDNVAVQIIHSGIGSVAESDVKVALGAPGSIIFAFNVKTDTAALNLADRSTIPVESFNIIYKLSERIQEIVTDRVPKPQEEIRGVATILKVFSKQKDKQILGGKVNEGLFKVGEIVKIKRRDAEIGTGKIRNLQQMKADVDEVVEGKEFGGQIESKVEIASGDTIEAFKLTKN